MSSMPPPPPGSPTPPPPPPPGYGAAPPPPPVPPPSSGAWGGTSGIGSPGASAPRGELAGFWRRFGAMLLDSLLYGLIAAPFIIAGTVLITQAYDDCVSIGDEILCPPGKPETGPIAGGIALIVAGILLFLILYIWHLGKSGQTWGRKISGIKVVNQRDGSAPGIGKAIGRTLFARFISSNCLLLGYLWMLWDDENQTWHDKVCDTLVVRTD